MTRKVLYQTDRLTVTEGGLPLESTFVKKGKCTAPKCPGPRGTPKFVDFEGRLSCWYCGEVK